MADDKNRVDAWMPMWIGDYLADTMSLTRDLHGGYLLLLFAYWRNRGPLPDDDDDMAAIVRSNPAEWRKTLRPKLERFFTVADGAWSHSRADKELDAAGVRKEKAAAKAKAGAQARWGKTNKQCSKHAPSIAKALHEDCPSPSPSPIGTEDFKGSQGACDLADDSALGDEPPPPDAPPPAAEDGAGLPEATPTPYGLIAGELKRAGVMPNAGHPRFRALVDAGADALEFLAFVDKAKREASGDPFPYIVGAVWNERKRAKATAGQLHHGAMPAQAPTAKAAAKAAEVQAWFGTAFQPQPDEDAQHGATPLLG